jgi:hypothetical protein
MDTRFDAAKKFALHQWQRNLPASWEPLLDCRGWDANWEASNVDELPCNLAATGYLSEKGLAPLGREPHP